MFRTMFVAALFSFTGALHADYVLQYQSEGETQTFETQTFNYRDASHTTFVTSGEGGTSSIYRIGEKIYLVSDDDGDKSVMDMDEMKKMTAAMQGSGMMKETESSKSHDYKIKKTGKKVTVGGVKGEVWIVEGTEDGEPYKEEVVVTNDKRIVKTFDAMMAMFAKMGEGIVEMPEELNIEKGYAVIRAEGMELKSFSEKSLPQSSYELPKGAKQQKMPDFGAIMGGGKSGGTLAQSRCYQEVCCGKTAGESRVLHGMLKARSGGYELEGDGICDVIGIASLFGSPTVEGALYRKGNDTIQLTLNLDDKGEGSVRGAKEASENAQGVVAMEVKDYKKGVIGSATYYYGLLEPQKQQTLDIIIDSKTTLSVTRIAETSEIDLISWAKRTIDLDAFSESSESSAAKPEKKTETKPSKQDDTSLDTDALNKNVDEAVQMFKSLF